MDFFDKYKSIIARVMVIIFIFGGGCGIVFHLASGGSYNSIGSLIVSRNINPLEKIKVEDYYKVYDKGKNYKIYIKRIFSDVDNDYSYFKKYELFDSKGNCVFEKEGLLANIRITKHDFDILEINEYYNDEEGTEYSFFYNVKTNAIGRCWYITIHNDDGMFFVKTKEGTATLILSQDAISIAHLYDRNKYFKSIQFQENQKISAFEKVRIANENEVEVVYYDADYTKHTDIFPLYDDEAECRSYDLYANELKNDSITIDQNLYESLIENITYDEVCSLIGAEGEYLRGFEESSIRVYGYKGESQEIFLTFSGNILIKKERHINVSKI